MENSPSVPSLSIERCDACFVDVVNDDIFCPNCGYPLKGTELEQKTFIAVRNNVDIDLAEFNKKIRKAGNSLYYLSGVFVLVSIIIFFKMKDDADVAPLVISNLILAILFLALGGYSRKKPLVCLVCGLCLYVIVQILGLITNPASIISGIIFKIAIIAYLVVGIKSALEIEKIKKENNIV